MPIIDLGKYGWATRDCPNVLIPDIAATHSGNAGNIGPGPNWTLPPSTPPPGTWATLLASTAYPFLLNQLHTQFAVGQEFVADGGAAASNLCQVQIATGAAGSEVVVASAITAQSSYAVITGLGAGGNVIALATLTRDIDIGPVLIPPSTRIAFTASVENAPSYCSLNIFASGYDLTKLGFSKHLAYDELLMFGSRPTLPKPFVTLGSTPVTTGTAYYYGNYATILDPLDADYLVWGAAVESSSGTIRTAQFAAGLAAHGAGANTEVIQARFDLPIQTNYLAAGHEQFKIPFIAYKGERLSVCGLSRITAGLVYKVMLYGVRLS